MKIKLVLLLFVLLSYSSCKDKNDDDNVSTEMTDDEFTNRWAYNKMKSLYLWNTNLPASPDFIANPKTFFESILYQPSSLDGDRFSWIEKDKSKKTKSLFAAKNLGFEYMPKSYFKEIVPGQTNYTSIGYFVLYVYPGSDAEVKGLKRGNIIYAVDGVDITSDNYVSLLDDVSSVALSIYDSQGVKKVLSPIKTVEEARSPVFMSKVISGTKIGYLVYSGFERGPDENDDDNYEYDIELIRAIKGLNDQGITDFVLDLRYNPGGYLTSAMNLASTLVPNRKAGDIFVKETYNTHFQDSVVRKYGERTLEEPFLDKAYGTNEAIPRLNLSRLYVLAAEYTASASELVMHGLKPYMTVIHIGETTYGKDKGSITVKSDNERIKWQLQPIISRFTDKNGKGNYVEGLRPDYKVSEWEECYSTTTAQYEDGSFTEVPVLSRWIGGLVELGDPSEPLLAEAIARINGTTRKAKVKSVSPSNGVVVKVPRLKYNEDRQLLIMDQDKYSN